MKTKNASYSTAALLALAMAFQASGQVAARPIGIKPAGVAGNAPGGSIVKASLELVPNVLNMEFLKKNRLGYIPSAVSLVETKPAGILKEPAYRGKPLYGAFVAGNGPKSVTYFAIDEIKGQKGRIYVDLNQNGDLTDDGSPEWDESRETDGITSYNKSISLHASYGTPVQEQESGTYSLFAYKRDGDTRLGFTKTAVRSGKVQIGDKTYSILLAENTGDGIFTVAKHTDRTRRPVDLFIDVDGDGSYSGAKTQVDGKDAFQTEHFRIDTPFFLGGKWWDASPSASGSELLLLPSEAPGKVASGQGAPTPSLKLAANGTLAPDFVAQAPDGKPLKLSDFKGKVVLLDFWATWCGPCQASMPGLQKIYDQVKSKGVVVLSLNVFDAKAPFDAWIEKNSGTKYSFTFAFDKAGHDQATSIAASKFGVSGIPTMFVIDKDGKIHQSIVGSGNEAAIVKALGELGISAKAD